MRAVHDVCVAGHTKAVLGVRQHPSLLNMAVSCGEDRLIKVWSLNDGICQRSILCRSKPLDVAFTSNGQCIVSAHYDGSLHVFDASTGSEMRVVDAVHRKEFGTCVAVVPTAQASRVASVGRDNAVCITDVHQGEVRMQHCDNLEPPLFIVKQLCAAATAQLYVQVLEGASKLQDLLTACCTGVRCGSQRSLAMPRWLGVVLSSNSTRKDRSDDVGLDGRTERF